MSVLTQVVPGTEWLPLLAELAAKATVILLLAAAAAAILSRSSAAVRHMVWCAGVAGVLALPLLSALVPAWEVPLLPAAAPTAPVAFSALPERAELPALSALSEAPPATPALPVDGAWVPRLALAVAAAGVLAGLLWLAAGFWGVARLGRRAEVVRDPEWLRAAQDAADRLGLRRPVLLLRSRGALMPATWGLLWPSVVLPSTADEWPEDRRHAVLAHELAHVKRFDCLTQALAQVVCVLFWWHPVVWYAARRLRIERERACDDLVLGIGARASDYASHLLEIARAHRGLRLGAPALVSMAKPSQLESRLLSVLDGARARGAPGVRATLLCTLAALLVAGSLSALRPAAASAVPVQVPAPGAPAPEPAPEVESVAPRVEVEISPAAEDADTIPPGEIEELIAMRSVGVDAEYIDALRAAGYSGLSADDLTSMRAVGVTVRYIAEMNAAGFGRLTPDQLVSLRAVGVTPGYLAELGRYGFTELSFNDVMGMRAVGVDGGYIEELVRHGIEGLSADEITGMRAVGVTGDYIEQMRALGLGSLDADALADLRAVGVTPAYVRELAAEGIGPLTPEQLVRLRASGVDRELIESRNRTRP